MTNRADFGEVPKKHGVPGGLIMIIIRIDGLYLTIILELIDRFC